MLNFLQVVVAAETGGALGGMVRQLSIDQFENEGRRVSYGTPESATAARKLLDRQMSINSVPKKVQIHLYNDLSNAHKIIVFHIKNIRKALCSLSLGWSSLLIFHSFPLLTPHCSFSIIIFRRFLSLFTFMFSFVGLRSMLALACVQIQNCF